MNAEIIYNVLTYPLRGDWIAIGVLFLIAISFILGQRYASYKGFKFVHDDWFRLSLAYLGVALISLAGLVQGGIR